MTKHTPGPWRYVDGYFDCDVWAGNKKVLSYERHPTDEDRANARLMAAAPELLEACRVAVMALAAAAERDPAFNRDYEAVSAAIASATEAV